MNLKSIIQSTLVLTMIGFVSAFALSHIKKITYPNIVKLEKQKIVNSLAMALPGFTIKDEKKATVDGKEFQYWTAEKNENGKVIRGYAFITEKGGYGGPIRSIVGIDETGKIIGLSILQQSETPGLGARSIEMASSETFFGVLFGTSASQKQKEIETAWFQEQFKGLDTNRKIEILKKGEWNEGMKQDLLDKNAISAITGATITTKAVRDSIDLGIQTFRKALEMEKNQEVKK